MSQALTGQVGRLGSSHDRLRLILPLIRREVAGRYRGSALGVVWSLLTPLFLLGVFTFVFGTVFKSRWTPPPAASTSAAPAASATTGVAMPAATAAPVEPTTFEFAITLFVGLIVFQLFADVVNRAPSLILANQNYVKKIVFPLEVLVPVALGTALFHAAVSLGVLFAFMLPVYGGIPWTALLLPVVVAPFCLVILGVGWFLASLGTYVRDIGQLLGTVVMALMFLSPIFFPLSALPEWIRPWVALNPIAWPVEEARNVLIWGRVPDLVSLVLYTGVASGVAILGYLWFQKTRKGFADVL